MINPGAPSNGCETNARGGPGYRAMLPLHVSYRGSQLSYAVHYLQQHPDTRLVTIGIGANDLFRCQAITADHCGGSDLGPTLAEVTSNLNTILGALRNQAQLPAHPGGAHLLRGELRRPGVRHPGRGPERGDRRARGTLRRPSSPTVSPRSAPRRPRPAANTCAAGLRIKLASGGCDLHPSALGQQVLAAAIQAALGILTRR